MTPTTDDACPFDWAEFNLPAELLPRANTLTPLALGIAAALGRNQDNEARFEPRLNLFAR